MELEKQVCSLELAKRLKELGAKQESYSWWTPQSEILPKTDDELEETFNCNDAFITTTEEALWKDTPKVSAFTVADLGH